MTEKEINYKNEKLTKLLLQLKSLNHKLNFKDKKKLKYLKRYNIPISEIQILEKELCNQGHLEYTTKSIWHNSDGIPYLNQTGQKITEDGLFAIKHNFYDVHFLIKKLNQIQIIPTIILTIITIIATSFGIISNCSNTYLQNELDKKQETIDSLKVIIKQIKPNK